MQIDLWHGTNQNFEEFQTEKLGLNTSNPASRVGFFFAEAEDTARDYAHQASRNLVPDQEAHEAQVAHLLEQAEQASRQGNYDLHEKILLEAETLETDALQAEPTGMQILRCRITYDNPLKLDGSAHAVVINLGEVLENARDAGYDAVILKDIRDTPSGLGDPDVHVVVFDPRQIEILDRFEIEPQVTEDEMPEMA